MSSSGLLKAVDVDDEVQVFRGRDGHLPIGEQSVH